MMSTNNSQYILPLSSSSLRKTQPQNLHPVDYTGSSITLVSKYGLRYQGFLYHLNHHNKTLCLLNVICYGTEDRSRNGFQIPPSYELYSYIIFTTTQIKNVVVDSHASLLARGGLSSKIYRPPKALLPYVFSSYNQDGAKICQRVPLLISNEKFSNTEAITYDYDASSYEGPVNDGLQVACKPLSLQQYPGLNYYDFWLNHVYQPMPCAALYQDLTNTAPSSIAPQSFFTTDPPVPISLRPGKGGFYLKTLIKNFIPYKLWGPEGGNNQEDQTACTVDGSSYQDETWSSQGNKNQEDQTAYTIDGSSYQNETWSSQGNNNQEDQTASTIDGSSYQNETWSSQGNNNQEDQTASTIDGPCYTNSRNPFDPIGRPRNPFGPIERAFSYLPSSHELADLGFV